MIQRHIFAGGISRLGLRFKLPSMDALEELREYLTPRLTDKQFQAACETLWADQYRFPRPIDFLESAPPFEPESIMVEGPQRDPTKEAPVIRLRRGSAKAVAWQRHLAWRRRNGIRFDTDLEGWPVKQTKGATWRLPVVELVD